MSRRNANYQDVMQTVKAKCRLSRRNAKCQGKIEIMNVDALRGSKHAGNLTNNNQQGCLL